MQTTRDDSRDGDVARTPEPTPAAEPRHTSATEQGAARPFSRRIDCSVHDGGTPVRGGRRQPARGRGQPRDSGRRDG